jgi:sporulation protein YlmC with PRC-barrel domain
MKRPIYIEDNYGHHVYKANGKVLTDIKAVEIDGVHYGVTSRLVEVSISEMGHHSTFKTKRYFIKYEREEVELFDFCWFDPEDEWFADEGPATFEVRTLDVTYEEN